MPEGHTASVLVQTSFVATSQQPTSIAFYGTEGTLQLSAEGLALWPSHIHHYSREQEAWDELPVPQEFADALPKVEDPVQRDWNQLFAEFVADVRGEGYAGYPTFHDGWVANEVIDIVRSNKSWVSLPEQPAS
jgi:hypothetical protein